MSFFPREYEPYQFAKLLARKSAAFRTFWEDYLSGSNLTTDAAIAAWLESTHNQSIPNRLGETYSVSELWAKWKKLIDEKNKEQIT